MRRMILALYLLAQVMTLSAGMPIFPNCYGEIAKCKVVDTAMYEVSYKIVAKLYTDPKYLHRPQVSSSGIYGCANIAHR